MIDTKLILENQVSIGQEFKSYADLCKHIGIPATTGKQRISDQQHMKCYFDWEKAEHGNKLTITNTHYDNPKEFVDNRNGTHITPTIEMMMNLFLNTPWDDTFYTKTNLLYEMELFNDEIRVKKDNQEREVRMTAEKDYWNKLLGHITSTITQINKSDYGRVELVVVNLKTKEVLDKELRDKYYDIKSKTLEEFGEKNEGWIYRHGKWNDYRAEIDKQTREKFHQYPIYERFKVSVNPPQDVEPVSREVFFKHIGEEMMKAYTKKHGKAIGYTLPKLYKEGVDKLISELITDYLTQQAEIESNLQESKKIVYAAP